MRGLFDESEIMFAKRLLLSLFNRLNYILMETRPYSTEIESILMTLESKFLSKSSFVFLLQSLPHSDIHRKFVGALARRLSLKSRVVEISNDEEASDQDLVKIVMKKMETAGKSLTTAKQKLKQSCTVIIHSSDRTLASSGSMSFMYIIANLLHVESTYMLNFVLVFGNVLSLNEMEAKIRSRLDLGVRFTPRNMNLADLHNYFDKCLKYLGDTVLKNSGFGEYPRISNFYTRFIEKLKSSVHEMMPDDQRISTSFIMKRLHCTLLNFILWTPEIPSQPGSGLAFFRPEEIPQENRNENNKSTTPVPKQRRMGREFHRQKGIAASREQEENSMLTPTNAKIADQISTPPGSSSKRRLRSQSGREMTTTHRKRAATTIGAFPRLPRYIRTSENRELAIKELYWSHLGLIDHMILFSFLRAAENRAYITGSLLIVKSTYGVLHRENSGQPLNDFKPMSRVFALEGLLQDNILMISTAQVGSELPGDIKETEFAEEQYVELWPWLKYPLVFPFSRK